VTEQLAKLPVPLTVYVFSTHQATVRKLERELESGSFSVNQVMMHATNPFLPFGGKGKSGLGRYHGLASFQALSYQRGAYIKKRPLAFSKQFPPYSSKALGALRKLRRKIF